MFELNFKLLSILASFLVHKLAMSNVCFVIFCVCAFICIFFRFELEDLYSWSSDGPKMQKDAKKRVREQEKEVEYIQILLSLATCPFPLCISPNLENGEHHHQCNADK